MKRYFSALIALSALVVAGISAAPAGAATADDTWQYVPTSVGGTYTPIVGNFDGNDTTDVLWYTPNASSDSLWLFREGTRSAHISVPESIGSPHIPIVGNFAGDWRDDILWYTPGAGVDPLWVANSSAKRFDTTRTLQVRSTYQPVVLHDWRSSTTHDRIVWYSPSSTSVTVWRFGSSNTVSNAYTAVSGTIPASSKPVVGDWNLDGIDDLVWYGPGSAGDAKWLSRGDGSFTKTAISAGGAYQPVAVWGTWDDGLQPAGDSILWWGNGAAADAYWMNDGSAFHGASGAASTASGTPFPLFSGVDVVYEPNGPEQVFLGIPDFGPIGYDVASPTGRDIGPGIKPLSGDFDGDGGPDVLWYGPGAASDEIWYLQVDDSGALSKLGGEAPSSPARPAWAERIADAVRNGATRR